MNGIVDLFDVQQSGSTVVITLLRNPTELGSTELLDCDPGGAIRLLESQQAKNVIINCQNIDRCCSSALGLFVKLWKRTQANGGRFVFCNLCGHLRQVVEILRLDSMWPVFDSLAEAIEHAEK